VTEYKNVLTREGGRGKAVNKGNGLNFRNIEHTWESGLGSARNPILKACCQHCDQAQCTPPWTLAGSQRGVAGLQTPPSLGDPCKWETTLHPLEPLGKEQGQKYPEVPWQKKQGACQDSRAVVPLAGPEKNAESLGVFELLQPALAISRSFPTPR